MASIWDFLDSLPKRSDVTPEELARRRQGYADLYQGGLLAGNRGQMPLSVRGAQATQDFLPVIGDALALGEAGEALSRGELAAAGLLGTGALIGLVPSAGDALAKPVMAAGRRAADIARRIEVDPNALGSMGGNIRLKPESVSPAQEVAGLLSSGRADEVTDEMLAKFTPKDEMEIFGLYQRGATGMDLPMDEASRMARAREMGFGGDMYHGTGYNFKAADPSRARFDSDGTGFYTTDDPYVASSYAERDGVKNGKVYPMRTREDVPQVYADYEGGNWDEFRADLDPSRFGSTKDHMYDPFGWEDVDPEDLAFELYRTDDIARSAKMDGHEAAIFENVTDHVSVDDLDPSRVRVDFNPRNIRSRFARFDPRLAHLRNLSAGVGGLGLLSSMMPPEEQY